MRIVISEAEKTELDMSEGQYDFNISTGIVLLTIAFYLLFQNSSFPIWGTILMVSMGIILFVGGSLERKEGFIPLYTKLVHKYSRLM